MKKLIKKKSGSCAPLALQYLSGLDEQTVFEVCASNGFEQELGMEEYEFLDSATELNIRFRRVPLKKEGIYSKSLKTFISRHKCGTFLVYTPCHILVVEDSKIIDPLNPGYLGLYRSVTGAWKVSKRVALS